MPGSRVISPLRSSLTFSLVFLLVIGIGLPFSLSVRAAGITITTTNDTIADDGACSLREAIIAANTNSASGATPGECPAGSAADIDVITVPAGTYTLAITGKNEDAGRTGDLDINGGVSLVGAGAASTIISGGGIDRVFDTHSGAVSLSGMTIQNGRVDTPSGAAGVSSTTGGAGILVEGTSAVTIAQCTITANAVVSNGSGRIINGAGIATTFQTSLMLQSSIVTGNSAIMAGGVTGGSPAGAGVSNGGGTLSVIGSTISNNTAVSHAGIESGNGTVTITNSTISGNVASNGAAGMWINGDQFSMTNSTVTGNNANTGQGGGLFLVAGSHTSMPFQITGSTISNNAGTLGGGIYFYGALNQGLNISTTTISGNQGTDGGGLWAKNGATITLAQTTLSGNSASGNGGALYFDGVTPTITNSTLSGNSAAGSGGAIYVASGATVLSSVTAAQNSTGIAASGTTNVRLTNTLLANTGVDCQVIQYAPFQSFGHNLSGDNSCTALTGAGDLRGVSPSLAPLAVNVPGSTATHALLPNSPAINRGATGSDCPATDQRGSGRPVGVACDIGAYELYPLPAPTITGVSPASGPQAGGGSLTISGSGFYVGTSVTVGGAACANVSVAYDASSLACTIPVGTQGQQDVVVTVAGGGVAMLPGGYYYGTRPNGAPISHAAAVPVSGALPAPAAHSPGMSAQPSMPLPQPGRH